MGRYLRMNDVLKELKIGNANTILIDSKKLHETLLELYEKGITLYTPGY